MSQEKPPKDSPLPEEAAASSRTEQAGHHVPATDADTAMPSGADATVPEVSEASQASGTTRAQTENTDAVTNTEDTTDEPRPAESSTDNVDENVPTNAEPVEPMKGVGFLGRRGTAPINTSTAADGAPAPGGTATQGAAQSTATARQPAAPPQPGMAEHSFQLMSYAGLLFLILLLTMQTAAGIYFPTIFFPQEAALAEVYELMTQAGQWLAPPATAALPAALPGYFWFLAGVDMLPGLGDPFILPAAAALSALVALLGTYTLGLCVGLGNRISFAAGLMLLSTLGFVPLTHWVGPDVLLAGVLALSLGCLYRGWASERAFLWLALGFVLAGVATLVGGLVALWVPLLASIVFIFWRGTLRRSHRLDAVLGFALLLISIASWLGAVILLTGDSAAVLAPLFDQLFAPLLPPLWPPKDPWWLGLALLGAGLVPWIFVPLFVSWNRVAVNAWPALKASRKEKAGVAWLWICMAFGVALLLLSSAKPLFMAVPLLPLAVLLLAKALLHLSHTGSRLLFLILALLCLVAGAALSAAGIPAALHAIKPYLPALMADMAAQSVGLPLLGGVLLLTALVLVRFTNRAFPGGSLAVFVLLMTMLVQPATLLTGPSHAGKIAVYLPRGMGVGVLAGGAPVAVPQAQPKSPAPAAPKASPEAATPPAEQPSPAEAAQPVQPVETAPASPAAPETLPKDEAPAPAMQPAATPEVSEPAPAPEVPAAPKAPEEPGTGETERAAPPAAPAPQPAPQDAPASATPL